MRDLAQMGKTLVAYWLGALPKVAGSNPGGSMGNYFSHIQWLLIFISTRKSFHNVSEVGKKRTVIKSSSAFNFT